MSKNMREINIELYKKAYLIRKTQVKICENYKENEMKNPIHTSMGEEAIASGVCQALNHEDQIFGSCRGHGIYLARTCETDGFFAELYGKKTGVAKGRAGSMHLSSPESNLLGTSAIVASTIPVAVGASYMNKQKNNGKLVAIFFGDGASDEGVFWESLNFSCLKKLPIIFVCEDNEYSVHSHISKRQGYKSITDVVSQFNCNVFMEETTDPEVIYKLTRKAIQLYKKNLKPCFLHFKYYRYLEHVGTKPDFKFKYRSEDVFREWYKIDPIKIQREKLLKKNYCSEKEIKEIEKKIDLQIKNSIRDAREAPYPDASDLFKEVYA